MAAQCFDMCLDVTENGSMSLHVVGPDGTILWANSEELNTLGYKPEEYIGKPIAQFHCDQAVIKDILERLGRFETIKNYPARLWHADGSVVHVEITSSVNQSEDGRFKHTRCFTSNVTSRVLLEAEREIERAKHEALVERQMTTMLQQHAAELENMNLRLEKEQQLRQCLLNSILPPAISSALMQGDVIKPEFFQRVTVFFSDIVGFTDIANKVAPEEVFALLNKLYTVMDLCASTMDVYKVETIGDAYMAVGGIQDSNENHSEAIAEFALLVQKAVEIVPNPLSPHEPVKLRIGIHTGPVVAGIVGQLMPRYCLFGDTVNVASRMESTGEAAKIHCSDTLTPFLSSRYSLLPRGEIEVKGKGVMKTWWLDSKAPAASRFTIRAIQEKAMAAWESQPPSQAFAFETCKRTTQRCPWPIPVESLPTGQFKSFSSLVSLGRVSDFARYDIDSSDDASSASHHDEVDETEKSTNLSDVNDSSAVTCEQQSLGRNITEETAFTEPQASVEGWCLSSDEEV